MSSQGEHPFSFKNCYQSLSLEAKAVLPDVLYVQVMGRGLIGPAVPNVVPNAITLMAGPIGLSDSSYLVASILRLL